MVITNKIKCNHCGDIIESEDTYDFKRCRCRRVAVDGGHDYAKRLFLEEGDYTDLSVFSDDEVTHAD